MDCGETLAEILWMNGFINNLNAMPSEKQLYTLTTLPGHLKEAEQIERLYQVLTTFDFLQAKVEKLGSQPLIEDYMNVNAPNLTLIQSALQLSEHILAEDTSQLAGQLIGRLLEFEDDTPEIHMLLLKAKSWRGTTWLRPLTASLPTPKGKLIRVLYGHTDEVTDVTLMPDERHALSASEDGTIKMWDLENGFELTTIKDHAGPIWAIAVTPDGRRVISASDDGTVKIWDLSEKTQLITLRGHQSQVWDVVVTSDGRRALSASEDGTIKVWDLENGNELAILQGHTARVTSIAVASDGQRVLSASYDHTLKIWDLPTGTELASLQGHTGGLDVVAITPNESYALSASDDQSPYLWVVDSSPTRGAEPPGPKGRGVCFFIPSVISKTVI